MGGILLLAGCGGSNPGTEVAPRPLSEPGIARASVLPDLSGAAGTRLRREVARADREEMDPEVFAKVGDSNTEWPQNIYGLGCRQVGYGSNRDLEAVVERYSEVEFPGLAGLDGCSPINSLTRRSAAAVSGVWTEWLMTPTEDLDRTGISPPTDECPPDQTPLDCEIGLIKPRWALIMSGTNDALLGRPLGDTYRKLLEQMVDRVRQLGPVPVLSTLPPMAVPAHYGQPGEQRVEEANRIISQVAAERQVSLIDLHRALTAEGMVDDGLASDGLHLGVYGGEGQPDIMRGSAMLTIPALHYGANRRNLIWLQVLNRLDQAAAGR
ncbi:MAG: hypothetical protein BGO23_00485 [Solirubrobacterales bacterium 67-14]|nr:MAG: hypothetical protein BGO23_00485 [Solirubrobacterales bacterium 67-14]